VWNAEGRFEGADDEFKRNPPPGLSAEQKDWVHVLQSEGVIPDTVNTLQKRTKAATQFLRGVVKVPVEVDVGEETVRVMIVSRPLGQRRTAYALAVDRLPGGRSGAERAALPEPLGGVMTPAESAAPAAAPAAETGAGMPTDDGADRPGLWG
jgi:hypothetical protein